MKITEIPPYVPFRRPSWSDSYFWAFDVSDEGLGDPFLRAYLVPAKPRSQTEAQFDEDDLTICHSDLIANDFEICEEDKYWGRHGKDVFNEFVRSLTALNEELYKGE